MPPPPDAADRAWAAFSAATGAAAAATGAAGVAAAGRAAQSAAAPGVAARWFLLGTLGGGALVAGVLGSLSAPRPAIPAAAMAPASPSALASASPPALASALPPALASAPQTRPAEPPLPSLAPVAPALSAGPVARSAEPWRVVESIARSLESAEVDYTAARALPQRAPEEHLGLVEELARVPAAIEVEQIVEWQRTVVAGRKVHTQRLIGREQFACTGHHVGARGMERERCCSQRARSQPVVAVQPGDDLARGAGHALVDCLALALVGLADNVGQPVAVGAEDVECAVGRTAVDDDVLDVRVALREYRPDRLLEILALVSRRRDDRDARPGGAARQRRRQRGSGV